MVLRRGMSTAVSLRAPLAGVLVGMLVGVLLGGWAAAPAQAVPGPSFEPVKLQRIALPRQIREASTPVFTRDGRHLLFFSAQRLWIVGDHGIGLRCLSCGLANQPTLDRSEQEGFATEFPDRRRVFFGAAGSVAVLECRPSVLDCTRRRILPIDLTGAHGGAVVGPGGPNSSPALNEGNASSPKLAPDGVHIAFSDIRTDAAEVMIIATLKRTATRYLTTDPRVINPAGPTSATDHNTLAWSNSSGLFEFKSFADGGADATYVQVGGDASLNPDVWQVNLATGERARLTSYPDWDEDNAPSPDGRSIVIESDRGMHRVDMLGALMPVRGFVDDPEAAVTASYFVAGAIPRQCDLQPWLLPASGDRGATLMGQPLDPYAGGPVHAANNVSGYPQWSPDGTQIALNTESYQTNRSARYLLVAHLISRRAARPERIVSSQPGEWAPAPGAYHGPIGAVAHIVLPGLRRGTATVDYNNTQGLLAGTDSVSYRGYSDNGRDFVSGTYAITDPGITNGPIRIDEDLIMTGADTGQVHVHLTFSGVGKLPVTVTGTASSSYDGTTVTGIPHVPRPCPQVLPRAPRMQIAARLVRHGNRRFISVHLTATVARAGANERRRDTRPVKDATVTARPASATSPTSAASATAGATSATAGATTSASGDALISIPAGWIRPVNLRAVAGDTLRPVTAHLKVGGG